MTQFFTGDIGLRPFLTGSTLSKPPASTSAGLLFSGLTRFASATAWRLARLPVWIRPADAGRRRLLLPGFCRLGRPRRHWVWLRW